jgi:hypothetical protein
MSIGDASKVSQFERIAEIYKVIELEYLASIEEKKDSVDNAIVFFEMLLNQFKEPIHELNKQYESKKIHIEFIENKIQNFKTLKSLFLNATPSVSNQNVPMTMPTFIVSEHVKMFDKLLNDNYANFVKGIDSSPIVDYGNSKEISIISIDAYKKGQYPDFGSIAQMLEAKHFINFDSNLQKTVFESLSNLFERDGFTYKKWVIFSNEIDRVRDWGGEKSLYSDLENAIKHPERFTKSYQQEKVVSNELETIYDFDEVGQSYYAIFREMRHYIDVIKAVSKTYGHYDSTPSVPTLLVSELKKPSMKQLLLILDYKGELQNRNFNKLKTASELSLKHGLNKQNIKNSLTYWGKNSIHNPITKPNLQYVKSYFEKEGLTELSEKVKKDLDVTN